MHSIILEQPLSSELKLLNIQKINSVLLTRLEVTQGRINKQIINKIRRRNSIINRVRVGQRGGYEIIGTVNGSGIRVNYTESSSG